MFFHPLFVFILPLVCLTFRFFDRNYFPITFLPTTMFLVGSFFENFRFPFHGYLVFLVGILSMSNIKREIFCIGQWEGLSLCGLGEWVNEWVGGDCMHDLSCRTSEPQFIGTIVNLWSSRSRKSKLHLFISKYETEHFRFFVIRSLCLVHHPKIHWMLFNTHNNLNVITNIRFTYVYLFVIR